MIVVLAVLLAVTLLVGLLVCLAENTFAADDRDEMRAVPSTSAAPPPPRSGPGGDAPA